MEFVWKPYGIPMEPLWINMRAMRWQHASKTLVTRLPNLGFGPVQGYGTPRQNRLEMLPASKSA